MDEQLQEQQQEQPTPEVAAPTPVVAVDMEALDRVADARAERAKQSAAKDTLRQWGHDEAALKGLLDEWKARQPNPAKELATAKETIAALNARLESERQEKTALAKGVPLGSADEASKAKAEACIRLARTYMSETVTFEQALETAMGVISFTSQKQKPPPMWAGSGTKPIGAQLSEKEEKKRKYLGLK